MIISVCNLKGGAGKTTTAINIAVYLAHKKKTVCIIDADVDQQSATIWGSFRAEDIPKVDVLPISKKGFTDKVRGYERKYDVIIIDAPPRLAGITDIIIDLADLLILPVKPSPPDFWAFDDFLEKVDEFMQEDGLPVYSVFVEFDSTEKKTKRLDKQFEKALEAFDIPVLVKIKRRDAHKNVFEKGIGSYESKNKLAKEEAKKLGSRVYSLVQQLEQE